ncbi:DNA-binding protein, partial [Candidatus Saccharibacteria bacterium]|nr:DNA-binding protein [Candidatus Saccharibacteria bacterium]
MAKQLSNSEIDRRNILNNPYAVKAIQKEVGFVGTYFIDEYKFTVRQVADFYEVDQRTIERYLVNYADELKENGYEILTGQHLKDFKNSVDTDTNVGINPKTVRLGVLNFKAFLNIGMLIAESEKARLLRSLVLNIVLDVVGKKAGGTAKYINQRDDTYLISLYVGENYRKDFTDALKECVDMGNFKYPVYTNKIYKSIFKEHAGEYRSILSLTKKENVRNTMYSEVLTTISMYETGLANEIKKKYKSIGRKLKPKEVDEIFEEFEKNPAWVPQIEMARMKMASRDYGFREVLHPELANYVNPLNTDEFERFLGDKSAELADRIEQYKDVF